MRKSLLALGLFLWGAACALGQSVTIPSEVKAPVGRLGSVLVSYDGSDFKYTAPADFDVFREYDPDPKKIRLRFIAYVPGKYQIFAIACKDNKLSEFGVCTVIVGDVPPGPTPIPPGPTPVPPGPVDPALAGLEIAFREDASSGGTLTQITSLASVYRGGADAVMKMPDGASYGDFWTALANTSKIVVPPGQLPRTKAFLGLQLDKMLPMETAKPLTAADRQLIADKMKWAADLLGNLKAKWGN